MSSVSSGYPKMSIYEYDERHQSKKSSEMPTHAMGSMTGSLL